MTITETRSSVRGQEFALGLLLSALESHRVPHAYIFAGLPGVGKKTTARWWAQKRLCTLNESKACGNCPACLRVAAGSHPDVLWINFQRQAQLLKEPPEKQRVLKIDTLRDMEKNLRLKPLEGQRKIAVIHPADEMAEAAAHALLKILEEPPPETQIILIVERAASLLPTLRSRCQLVRFCPLPLPDLEAILEVEQSSYSSEERALASRAAGGSVTHAVAFLEKAEDVSFDWETAKLSELVSWCEGFQNPRLGRPAVEKVLTSLLGRFQEEVHQGRRPAEHLERVLKSFQRLRHNVSPALILEILLLKLRRENKTSR